MGSWEEANSWLMRLSVLYYSQVAILSELIRRQMTKMD